MYSFFKNSETGFDTARISDSNKKSVVGGMRQLTYTKSKPSCVANGLHSVPKQGTIQYPAASDLGCWLGLAADLLACGPLGCGDSPGGRLLAWRSTAAGGVRAPKQTPIVVEGNVIPGR